MDLQELAYDVAEGIATITINRPARLNALDRRTIEELHQTAAAAAGDPAVRAVILTGAGEKAFVAGADITELQQLSAPAAEQYATRGQELMWRLENLGKPVIAAINGYALGGGLELAMACTFRYAAEHARLGLPECSLGLIPGFGGTQRLPRLVGRGRALELILTGTQITAGEALAAGLVEKVVPGAELLAQTREAAGRIASRSQVSTRAVLKVVAEGLNLSPDGGCRLEAAHFGVVAASADAAEGCQAFLAKRPPVFKDG
jgi:enoyl-CoA hydratase